MNSNPNLHNNHLEGDSFLWQGNATGILLSHGYTATTAEVRPLAEELHKQGYTTIGCNRCTTPVLPGEPKRAGRWRHLGPWSVYCGINPTDLDPERSPAVEFSQDLVDRILGRQTDFMI